MKVFYSPEFKQRYNHLPPKIQKKAEEKENLFRKNPFDPRLKTHKLHGRLAEFWAFSINWRYRIIFKFFEGNIVRFYAIGDHKVYE